MISQTQKKSPSVDFGHIEKTLKHMLKAMVLLNQQLSSQHWKIIFCEKAKITIKDSLVGANGNTISLVEAAHENDV